jgi:CheY-like chemotaxis protein
VRPEVRIEPGNEESIYRSAAMPGLAGEAPIEPASGPLILIVEDEPNNRLLLQKLLSRMGHEWVCAINGLEAVEQATSRRFDLILMDLSLPEMDGWEATRAIRTSGIEVPIIATSAHAMRGDQERAIDAGCSEYITKPFDLVALRETVGKYLSAPQSAES